MYNEIKNDDDIRTLMNLYGGFHDSCIVSVNYSSGAFVDSNGGMADGTIAEHCVNMVVHSQWCKSIEMRFTGVRKCSIVGWRDNCFCDIYDAHIGFYTQLLGTTCDDKLIVWADYDCFDPMKYTEDKLISSRNCTYVIAEKLEWKFINDID